MTRKHFEAIAASFRAQMTNATVPPDSRVTLRALAEVQADYFETVNPHFDRERFLTAAGMYV